MYFPLFLFIGSCTLTPATGKTKFTNVSTKPTISLEKISSNNSSKLIAPSVTLTPANPNSRFKRLKLNVNPTATITPVMKEKPITSGNLCLKPLFPSKPLEKAELGSVSFTKLGKPLIGAPTIDPKGVLVNIPLINPEQMIITPEIPQDDDDLEENEEFEDDIEENMVLEPQIILADDENDDIDNDDADIEEDNNGKLIVL